MQRKNFLIGAILIYANFLYALPVSAQTKKPERERQITVNLSPVRDRTEAFRASLKIGGDVFPQLLAKIMSEAEVGDTIDALEAQAVNFNDAIEEFSKDDLSKTTTKAREISRKNYEQLKANPPQAQTRKLPRGIGKSFAGADFFGIETSAGNDFSNAANYEKTSYENANAPADDAPKFETVETDSSVAASGTDSRTIDLPDATVTRSAKVDGKSSFDGKAWTQEQNQAETTEAISKTSNQKITKTEKHGTRISFDTCPDANGIVRGTGRVNFYTQTATNTGSDIAALTSETTIDFKITGYVNDDATMTHFDMEGTATETLTGFDRAAQHGLITAVADVPDGTRRINYQITNNQPPAILRDEYGSSTGTKDFEFGQTKATTTNDVSDAQAKRIGEAGANEINVMMLDLQKQMKSSIANWEDGDCVDVECTAPKSILKSGETVEVKATSISKKDLSKFNARLKASGTESVAPENQMGTPQAVFTLTAPAKGKAQFVVKSTSRRGIGLGVLDFGTEEPNDRDDRNCDGNWHGTLSIRETFEETFKGTTKPGDLGSDLNLSGWQETVNRQQYEAQVIIGTPVVVLPSSSLFDGKYTASGSKFYRTENYFTTPNECGWYKKTTITDDSGLEETETGSGEGATQITINLNGGEYYGSVGIPELKGTSFRTTWHKPAGYCQDANNKPTNSTANGATTLDRSAIEFRGAIDPRQPDVLTGTKTIKRDDGKGETVITWSIKRCAAVKPKLKTPVKKK